MTYFKSTDSMLPIFELIFNIAIHRLKNPKLGVNCQQCHRQKKYKNP